MIFFVQVKRVAYALRRDGMTGKSQLRKMTFGKFLFLYLLGRNTPITHFQKILEIVLLGKDGKKEVDDHHPDPLDENVKPRLNFTDDDDDEDLEMKELCPSAPIDYPDHQPGFPTLRVQVMRELSKNLEVEEEENPGGRLQQH